MDQFSAHLDRGWDLVQRGDPRGAEQSARRALELDAQSPEAHNLLGYVAALKGDYEEAIDSYRQAIALDDGYLEAMLNAAEVYVHPLGEFDEAISMCDQALGLAETDDEIVDALLLKFDALLGKGEGDEAREVCKRFPATCSWSVALTTRSATWIGHFLSSKTRSSETPGTPRPGTTSGSFATSAGTRAGRRTRFYALESSISSCPGRRSRSLAKPSR
jgi:hypothetical protein